MNIHKLLNLTKPLCFFDLETTGLSTEKDRIVEVCILKVLPSGDVQKYISLVNPEMEIPEESTNLHGITNEDVKNESTLEVIGQEMVDFIGDADICGFNSNVYDLPLMVNDLARVGVHFDYINRNRIDARTIFQRNNPFNLSAVYGYYTQKELSDAHTAEVDTQATLEIFEQQLINHKNLPKDLHELAKYSNWDKDKVDLKDKFIKKDGVIYFNFGKNKGIPCIDDKPYLAWIAANNTFAGDVRQIARDLLDGKLK